MALFTDGGITTLEELLAYESSLLETARTEGIDLAVKLVLAHEELGIDLRRFLVQQGAGGLALNHIVVTEPLKKCHTFRTLALTYRDAYNSQLNDRYLAKWKAWESRANWAWEALIETGVGLVEKPLSRAPRPQLSVVEGPGEAATYYVRVAWTNAAGEEGAESEAAVATTQDGQVLQVRAAEPPEHATGWNLYAGYSQNEVTLQNANPIELGQEWRLGAGGLTRGKSPSGGQAPLYYLQRGGSQRDPSGHDTPGLLLRG